VVDPQAWIDAIHRMSIERWKEEKEEMAKKSKPKGGGKGGMGGKGC
jgi:hypothetical protein